MDDAKSLVDEEWFFYFRVSSSLWKERIQGFKGSKIIVPINWAFHQIDEYTFDFGQNRKEANLKKIVTLAEKENKKVIFYLPLCPAPFLPNGGIPDFLKNNISINQEGLVHTCLDHEGNVNKLYSFFDKHIYRGFSFFVKNLGQFVKDEKINSDFWGVNLGQLLDGKFISYLEDFSPLFHKAFGQYIEALREQNKDYAIKSVEEELILIGRFRSFILDLYKRVAEEGLGANWEGSLDIALLGGNTSDFIKRCLNADKENDYTNLMKEGIFQGLIPSSILLGEESKSEIFNHQLNDLLIQSYLAEKLDPPLSDEGWVNFSLLTYFNVYKTPESLENIWQENGLFEFLNQKYKWAFKYFFSDDFNPYFGDESKINFLPGETIDIKLFQNILRNFMEGGKFVIEKDKLNDELAKKLELFVLENSIKVEKLKFFSEIQNITLGEGRILLFEGDIFKDMANNQKKIFWDKIINTFHLKHLEMDLPEGIDFFWSTRMVSPNEIKFEEIRRLHLYNTRSDKKSFKVKLSNKISLIKIADEKKGKVKIRPQSFEAEMGPSGSINMDFGIGS